MDTLRDLLHSDLAAATAQIETGAPEEITDRYEKLLLEYYWKHKDLPAVCAIAAAGIRYTVNAAQHAPELSAKLRHAARRIFYNVASFTWPGWEEPGINPTEDQLQFGRDAAMRSLQLAIELEIAPLGKSKSLWIDGAHRLAAGDPAAALQRFRVAHSILPPSDPSAKQYEPLNLGYIAIAQLAENPADVAAGESLGKILAQLQSQDDEESRDFLQQLQSARRLYAASRK